MDETPQALLREAQTVQGKRDPSRIFDRIRAQTRILRDDDSGLWYVFGWRDCNDLLLSREFGAPDLLQRTNRFSSSPSLQFLADTLSNLDPPHHTRLRGQVQKSFSTPILKRSAAYVEAVIEEAIEDLRDRPDFDVVGDYAALIPNTVICEMLGVPRADHGIFGAWLSAQFRVLAPTPPPDWVIDEVDAATTKLLDYMGDLIAERRRAPRTDIISELIALQPQLDVPMTVREMTVTATILLGGGSDTTKTAIAIGVRSLLENLGELTRLLQTPALESSMFEEVLRVGGAVVLANSRRALVDTQIAGQRIGAGELVVPVLASANYDPEKFDQPQRFDISRRPNPHIAFGAGVHVCVGNMLARMVGIRAITALVREFPTMRMLDDGRDIIEDLYAIRGLRTLHVATSP